MFMPYFHFRLLHRFERLAFAQFTRRGGRWLQRRLQIRKK
jgi:hypothetical protein